MRLKKALSLAALAPFLIQTAFGSVAESNLWAERRRELDRRERPQPLQVAALPNTAAILNQLPAPSLSLPAAAHAREPRRRHSTGPLSSILAAVPLQQASIGEVQIPARVVGAPVVIVQDVHLNPEAQTNIAAVLQAVADAGIRLVGVEGAFDAFDFQKFRSFPDRRITAEVARGFLERDLIAAPTFVGITAPTAPQFVGVDAAGPYAANVAAYLQSARLRPEAARRLDAEDRALAPRKKSVFPPQLRDFDGFREAYLAGKVTLGAYLERLARWSEQGDLEVEQFLAAYTMERSLDFARVDSERRLVIEKLVGKLSPDEISDLVSRTIAYRTGGVGFGDYYRELKESCGRHGIALARTPAFDAYIRYVLLSDGIRPDRLFASISRLERSVIARLATTDEQRGLVDRSERLAMSRKLINHALTPEEWDRFRQLKPSRDTASIDLAPFEAFYERADERSRLMVKALLDASETGGRALVVGGFHTPMILRLLHERGVPTAVVSPRITKVDLASGSAYLSIFNREKASLQQLFEGRALFLSPAMVAGVGTPSAAATARSEHLEATLAARQPGARGYSLSPAGDGFVRVRNGGGDLDVEVHPERYERRVGRSRAFRAASLPDRLIRSVVSPASAAYRWITAAVVPALETPLFAAVLYNMQPLAATLTEGAPALLESLAPHGGLLAPLVPALAALLLTATVLTLLHAVLNRDFRAASLGGWFVGSLLVAAPFLLPTITGAAALSFLIHAGWNSLAVYGPERGWRLQAWLRVPLSLMGFEPAGPAAAVRAALESGRGLVFTEDVDAIDGQLLGEARQTGEKYLRVTIRNQVDLDYLKMNVRAENGEIELGDGLLFDVIRNGGILLIDYQVDESNAHLVESLNSLFDKNGYYENVVASPKLRVVGAIPSSSLKMHPVSFYSRFRRIVSLDDRAPDPLERMAKAPEGIDAVEVELFESPAILEALVGTYRLDAEGRVQFEPGALVRALETGRPLVVRGADWKDPAVAHFVRQLIVRGEVIVNGRSVAIPADFRIYRADGNYASRPVTGKRLVPPTTATGDGLPLWVLNRENVDQLLTRTEVTRNATLVQRPGLLEQDRLRIRITDVLPGWAWHRLMHASADITLEVAPGIPVPEAYRNLRSEALKAAPRASASETWEKALARKAVLVETEDLGFARARIAASVDGPVTIIPVTAETTLSSLVEIVEIDTVDGRRRFNARPRRLIEALEAGRTVIIEGAEASPDLLRQLETALTERPYLMRLDERDGQRDADGRVDLSAVKGRLFVTARPSPDAAGIGSVRTQLSRDDQGLQDAIAGQVGGRFNAADFEKIMTLRRIFSTIPPPSRPNLYPAGANFNFDRLLLLYGFDNWLDAFENVYIADYADAPEVAAFMRVAVRMTFGIDEPGRRAGTIAGTKLDRALSQLAPSVPVQDALWRFADSLSIDLLQRNNVALDFKSPPGGVRSGYVAPALVKESRGERRAFYVDQFGVSEAAAASAPAIDRDTRLEETSWQERKERAVRIMKKFNAVFLKGSPGTGKSFITSQIAAELGYDPQRDVEGPVTVGADVTEGDIIGRTIFDGQRTVRIEEAVERWSARRRGLLIVDEANLTDPHFWNAIKDRIDDDHQVIFTGNQEFLAGRQFQAFFRERIITIPFPEFDDEFVKSRIDEYIASSKNGRGELAELLFDLTDLFRRMGQDKAFSLRDVQELVARTNEFTPPDWKTPESAADPRGFGKVILVAWRQYEGIFEPAERQALRHLIKRRYGVDVQELEEADVVRLREDRGAAYLEKQLTLVPSAGRTVRSIEDFLRLREARINGRSLIQGKRGVIYEGPSGRGKDDLLATTLTLNGFFEAKTAPPGTPPDRIFYHLNASLDYDSMVKAIKEAQRNGSIVIVSEMNLLPSALLEGKLNDVLTGNASAGFAFFATINNENFGGREKLSTALQNRVVYQKESDYSESELMEIAADIAAREAPGLSGNDLKAIVKAHVWIRDEITDFRYSPTTRDLRNAIVARDAAAVYGPLFLSQVLGGRSLPSRRALLKYTEKPRIDNVDVLQRMGRALLNHGLPFTVNVDASDPTEAGGYYTAASNSVTLRAAAFQTNDWQDTFWHEVSHGLFTRDYDGLTPRGDDPLDQLYQDLEDLRHEAAFNSFFPASRLDAPSRSELRMAAIVRGLDTADLLAWTRESPNRLTPRHMFQYALTAAGKKLITETELGAIAEIIEGIYPANPLALAANHADRARRIAASIPSRLEEDEIRFQQHRALVLMNEMRADFESLPDDDQSAPPDVSEADQQAQAVKAVAKLRTMDLKPLDTRPPQAAELPPPAAPPSAAEISRKKAELEDVRRASARAARKDARAGLRRIRLAARSRQLTAAAAAALLDDLNKLAARFGQVPDVAREAERLRVGIQKRIGARPAQDRTFLWPRWAVRATLGVVAAALTTLAAARYADVLMAHALPIIAIGLVAGLLWLALIFLLRPGALPSWLSSEGGAGDAPDTAAHKAGSAMRHNPQPMETMGRELELRPWTAPGFRDARLMSTSTDNRRELDAALADFVAKKLQAQRVYGREGVLEVPRFIRDPMNGFVRSGGREERVKKRIVVLFDGPDRTGFMEPINFLADSGFVVQWLPTVNLTAAQREALTRDGATEIVTAREIQERVEAIYLYGAFRDALDRREGSRVLTIDEQVAYANSIFEQSGGSGFFGAGDAYVQEEGGINLVLKKGAPSDLNVFAKLTDVTRLSVQNTAVSDLGPVRGMRGLREIFIDESQVTDLSPLLGLPRLERVQLGLDEISLDKVHEFIRTHPNRANLVVQNWHDMREIRLADVPPIDLANPPERTLTWEEQLEILRRPGFLGEGVNADDVLIITPDSRQIDVDLRGRNDVDIQKLIPFHNVLGFYFSSTSDVVVDQLVAFHNLKFVSFAEGGPDDAAFKLLRSHPNGPNLAVYFGTRVLRYDQIPQSEWSLRVQLDHARAILTGLGIPDTEVDQYIFQDNDMFTLDWPGPISRLMPNLASLTKMARLRVREIDTPQLDPLLKLPRLSQLITQQVDLPMAIVIGQALGRHPNRALEVLHQQGGRLVKIPLDEHVEVLVEEPATLQGSPGQTTAEPAAPLNRQQEIERETAEARRMLIDLGVPPVDAARAVWARKDGFGVRLSGVGVTDLTPFTKFGHLRALTVVEAPVSDLTPLLKMPKLANLSLHLTRVSADEVYFLLKNHPNRGLGAELNGIRRYFADLPPGYRPRRGAQRTDPWLSREQQLQVHIDLLRAAGVPEDVIQRTKRDANKDTASLDLPVAENLGPIASLDLLFSLYVPTLPTDLSPIMALPNLGLVVLSAVGTAGRPLRLPTHETPIERIYELLLAHPNPQITVMYKGAEIKRSQVPASFAGPAVPLGVDAGIPMERQIVDLGRYLAAVDPELSITELDGRNPTPEQVSIRRRELGAYHVGLWLAGRRIVMWLPTSVRSLAGLEKVPAITGINLYMSQIEDYRPIAQLVNLEEFQATSSEIRSLQPFANLHRLTFLDVKGTSVGDLSPLAGHYALKEIDVTQTKVVDISPLHGINLERVSLPWAVSEESVRRLAEAHPDPENLWITVDGRGTIQGSSLVAGAAASAPVRAPRDPEIAFLEDLLATMVNLDASVAAVTARFRDEGREKEFLDLFTALDLSASKPVPPPVSTQALAPAPFNAGAGPVSSSRRVSGADLDAIGDRIVGVALAADSLGRRDSAGVLIGDLLSHSAATKLDVEELVDPARGPGFGALVSNPDLDEAALAAAIQRALVRRGVKKRPSAKSAGDALDQVARRSLPEIAAGDLVDAALDDVRQVVMIVNGAEDMKKAQRIERSLRGRRPLLLIAAGQVTGEDGRVSLASVDLEAKRLTGLGLRGALLVLPDGTNYAADVPDDLLRALMIATINEMLNGTLLRGPTLLNIHRIARLVAMSA